jgi:hypothetical protein
MASLILVGVFSYWSVFLFGTFRAARVNQSCQQVAGGRKESMTLPQNTSDDDLLRLMMAGDYTVAGRAAYTGLLYR